MQVSWFLVFGCLSVAAIDVFEKQYTHINGQNGMYLPFPDGSLKWVSSAAFKALEKLAELDKKRHSIDFYVYTKENRLFGTKLSSNSTPKEIEDSGFNPERFTVFSTHGFLQNKLSLNINKHMRDAYFEKSDINYVYVQWLSANTINYIKASKMVTTVATELSKFYENLRTNYNLDCEKTELIGHSLGAHVVGLAAKQISCQIPRITGLDPASPLFPFNKPDERLNNKDAGCVETFQTNGGVFGHLEPVGSATFYVNGGQKQPGCLGNICNHERSVSYKIEAIRYNNFATYKCNDTQSAFVGKCDAEFSDVRMGNNRCAAKGIYYVKTNRRSPYGILKV